MIIIPLLFREQKNKFCLPLSYYRAWFSGCNFKEESVSERTCRIHICIPANEGEKNERKRKNKKKEKKEKCNLMFRIYPMRRRVAIFNSRNAHLEDSQGNRRKTAIRLIIPTLRFAEGSLHLEST